MDLVIEKTQNRINEKTEIESVKLFRINFRSFRMTYEIKNNEKKYEFNDHHHRQIAEGKLIELRSRKIQMRRKLILNGIVSHFIFIILCTRF